MIESSEIAYSFARGWLDHDEEARKIFAESSFHLHVPAGATPKDGPSAGITMALALVSLVLEQPMRKNLAMTGELSLTGQVMPIGGVKEKTIAAKRAKIKDIIFPVRKPQGLRGVACAHSQRHQTPFCKTL
jgi:ATP-dependent Lon protease